MNRLVSLRLRKLPQVVWHRFDESLTLQPEQELLVQTQAGKEIATVLRMANEGEERPSDPLIIRILRPISADDRAFLDEIRALETQAFKSCREKVESLRLAMRLLKAEYTYDKTRLIFYFKSDTKVDFRDLLKHLAGQFRPARIELKQIGVRDETKLLGGIGCCGKMVCCRQFLLDFHPVTTKMAKDQNMSLNPAKLSGICGRLLCCLSYEHKFYAEFQGKYPRLGAEVRLPDGPARAIDLNYLTQKLFVSYPDRRKVVVPLADVRGRKCPVTGRNLWWVFDPERPTWEPDFPPPPVSKKKAGKLGGDRPSDGQQGQDPGAGGPQSGPRERPADRGPQRGDAEPGRADGSGSGPRTGQGGSGEARPRRDRDRPRDRDRQRDGPRAGPPRQDRPGSPHPGQDRPEPATTTPADTGDASAHVPTAPVDADTAPHVGAAEPAPRPIDTPVATPPAHVATPDTAIQQQHPTTPEAPAVGAPPEPTSKP